MQQICFWEVNRRLGIQNDHRLLQNIQKDLRLIPVLSQINSEFNILRI